MTAAEHPGGGLDGARWVERQDDLVALVEELRPEPALAIDTEFHRERTYYPRCALVQIGWPGGIALLDPLSLDLRPLADLLEGPGLMVMHAAQQDLEVLDRACGARPATLFDTQLAAGFVGYSTPSLASLLAGELGVRVPKGDRLTDWLARPLTPEQRDYAAADVAHLLALHERLVARLEASGRLAWAMEECAELNRRAIGGVDPDDAWLRIKEHRHLRPSGRQVARSVAAWRERRAAALDQPVRHVLPDLAVLGLAQRPPARVEDLRNVRGLDERHARGAFARELLEAVEAGRSADPAVAPEPKGEDVERDLRPAVTLVSAWITQLARNLELDPALLATRADVVALLNDLDRAEPGRSRLAEGWRAQLVGDGIRRLVEGRAALAFEGGSLVLEDRA